MLAARDAAIASIEGLAVGVARLMANRSPNREVTDVLVRQSQVRRRVRQILWAEYPGQASPAVVERVCAWSSPASGSTSRHGGGEACDDGRHDHRGRRRDGRRLHGAAARRARLAERIVLVDVRAGVAQAMALDIAQALPSPAPTRGSRAATATSRPPAPTSS